MAVLLAWTLSIWPVQKRRGTDELARAPYRNLHHTAGLKRLDLGGSPPGKDVWVGYHRDLRRLARLRALLEATSARLSHREVSRERFGR
jgi:hypothetical protein